jgi:hypothetical protein
MHEVAERGLSLADSNQTSNKETDAESSSTQFSEKIGFLALFDGGVSSTWDRSTVEGWGTTKDTSSTTKDTFAFSLTWPLPADPLLIPGSGDTCASPTNCATLNHTSAQTVYAEEPFWQDTFVLLVHPQFADWVLGSGPDRFALSRGVPAMIEVTVQQLAACATGQRLLGQDNCLVDYSDAGLTAANGKSVQYPGAPPVLELSKTEAANLLKLDPFYGEGQSAALDATRAILVTSTTYGAMAGQLARPVGPETIKNTDAKQSSAGRKLTHSSSVVDVVGTSQSDGLQMSVSGNTGSIPAQGTEGLTITNGDKLTTETSMQVTYSDSTAVSTQETTTVQVTLNDVDNTTPGPSGNPACPKCHGPLPQRPSVNIYLDRVFGGFMFQDPRAPGPYEISTIPIHVPVPIANLDLSAKLLRVATHEEQLRQRFSDVPNDSPAKVAVGLTARTHVLSGFPDGTFHPQDPLTRTQLAAALAAALNLPPNGSPSTFIDLPAHDPSTPAVLAALRAGVIRPPSGTVFGPQDPISWEEMAESLALAFQWTDGTAGNAAPAVEKIERMIGAGRPADRPDLPSSLAGAVTREQAARVLLAALKDQQQQENDRSAGFESMWCSPRILIPDSASTCNITLSQPAPAGGAQIALSTESLPWLEVPASISVPTDSSTVSFTVASGAIPANLTGSLIATYNGSSHSSRLSMAASPVK